MTEPLVLLPGMGCSERLWSDVVALLDGVEAVCPRLSGSSLQECVETLLEQLPPRFALAGLSLGGIVAMALTRTAPHRVSRLCLLSTNAKAPTDAQLQGWTAQVSRLRQGQTAEQFQRDLLPVLLRDDRSAALGADTVTMAGEIGVDGLIDQLQLQATRVDERPALARVGVPTLVLAAADDALCPVAFHEELHALAPGSRLIVLPETGHLSTMERPAEVARALQEWLELPSS